MMIGAGFLDVEIDDVYIDGLAYTSGTNVIIFTDSDDISINNL